MNYKKKFIFFVLVLFISCTNPFQLRDSEDPLNSNIDNNRFFYQLNPDSLIVKMKQAFEKKDNQFYEDLFPVSGKDNVSFRFDPAPFYLDRLSNWTIQDEIGYFENLVKSSGVLDLQLDMKQTQTWVSVQESLDTLQAQYEYDIKLVLSPGKEHHYRGSATFKIFKGSDSYYRIFYWQDLPLSDSLSDSTWSALKAEYRINE